MVAQRSWTGSDSFASIVCMDYSQKSLSKASDSSKMLVSSSKISHSKGVNNFAATMVPCAYSEEQKHTLNSCLSFSCIPFGENITFFKNKDCALGAYDSVRI